MVGCDGGIKQDKSLMTLSHPGLGWLFQFISAASAAATIFAPQVKTIWAKS